MQADRRRFLLSCFEKMGVEHLTVKSLEWHLCRLRVAALVAVLSPLQYRLHASMKGAPSPIKGWNLRFRDDMKYHKMKARP